MEESWWEAVLAEEEAHSLARPVRNAFSTDQSNSNNKLGNGNHNYKAKGVIGLAQAGYAKGAGGNQHSSQNLTHWIKANELHEKDEVVHLQVTGFNRGGLLVSGEGLQGFVPLSHLVEAPAEAEDPEKWLQEYLNRTLCLKVIECDQERGRVVFSERAALSKPGSRRSLLKALKPGDCIDGIVTNITEFGVFVDLGGVEGLVHVSEISWGRVRHPSEAVQLGQQVSVHVLQVDQERARVALSLKRLRPNPWETAQERYFPGQVTEAVVTSILPFGAFVRLEEGLDGLIHISEMDCLEGQPEPAELLREGQRVIVRVLHVDAARQRLGLTLKTNPES